MRATDSAAPPTVLSASEVAEFGGYCPQAWWLRRQGVAGAAIGKLRRDEGVVLHRDRGRQTDRMRDADAGSWSALWLAVALAAVAALVLPVALIARAPLAWAAGEDSARAPNAVPGIEGVFGDASLAAAILVLVAASACALAFWPSGSAVAADEYERASGSAARSSALRYWRRTTRGSARSRCALNGSGSWRGRTT